MNMIYVKIRLIAITVLAAALVVSCSYSFTGASVPAHLKTVRIPLVKDKSGKGEPDLGNNFTNELIQKFLDDNNLEVSDKRNTDAILECSITSMDDRPETVSGTGEVATERRITITAKVLYKDLVRKKTIFDKTFSNFSFYNTTGSIDQARKDAISQAIDLLTEDILLGVVSNW